MDALIYFVRYWSVLPVANAFPLSVEWALAVTEALEAGEELSVQQIVDLKTRLSADVTLGMCGFYVAHATIDGVNYKFVISCLTWLP